MVWLPPATAGHGPAQVTHSFQVFVEAVPWGPVEETGPIVCPLAVMGNQGLYWVPTVYMPCLTSQSILWARTPDKERPVGSELGPRALRTEIQRSRVHCDSLAFCPHSPVASLLKNPFPVVWVSQGGLPGEGGGQCEGLLLPSSSPHTRPSTLGIKAEGSSWRGEVEEAS